MSRVFANGPETGVQSQVESYQRLKKWYLMPPCLALSTIKWGSRVKRSNPVNGVAPSPTSRCSSYWKGGLRVTLDPLLNGISTIVGYLTLNPVFTYLFDIWIVNTFCRYTQLKDQAVLFLTIQFSISQQSYMVPSIVIIVSIITNNSIKHQPFVYTQLNDQTVIF